MISVLYVDDEEISRYLSKFVLEKQAPDMSIIALSSPVEAMVYLKLNPVDVVVSDYYMEPVDGLSFLVMVRQLYTSLPFIMLTAQSKESVAITALNEDADYFLKKNPANPSQTYNELEHMIRSSIEKRLQEKSILKLKASLLALKQTAG